MLTHAEKLERVRYIRERVVAAVDVAAPRQEKERILRRLRQTHLSDRMFLLSYIDHLDALLRVADPEGAAQRDLSAGVATAATFETPDLLDTYRTEVTA